MHPLSVEELNGLASMWDAYADKLTTWHARRAYKKCAADLRFMVARQRECLVCHEPMVVVIRNGEFVTYCANACEGEPR